MTENPLDRGDGSTLKRRSCEHKESCSRPASYRVDIPDQEDTIACETHTNELDRTENALIYELSARERYIQTNNETR